MCINRLWSILIYSDVILEENPEFQIPVILGSGENMLNLALPLRPVAVLQEVCGMVRWIIVGPPPSLISQILAVQT